MKFLGKSITILMADDDPDDCLLVKDALTETRRVNDLHFVEDGEALMDYLHHRGKFGDPVEYPRPDLILLDLNMPKKDGREALKEIKSDLGLRSIPIIILTTSKEEEDIHLTYNMGASSFISKPDTFEGLLEVIESLGRYWFDTVDLPVHHESSCKEDRFI